MKYSVVKLIIALFAVVLYTSCVDGDDSGSYYTFTDKMVGEYIAEDPDYSRFSYLIKKAGMETLLNTYGNYTCFLPDNDAMDKYIAGLGISSLDELPEEDIKYLAYSHLLASRYLYADLNHGSAILNMNRRYLTVSIEGSAIYINTSSKAVVMNIELHNGIVHKVDEVISPSSSMLPDMIGSNKNLSIFHEALELTGWSDAMRLLEDVDFAEYAPIYYEKETDKAYKLPAERKFGYTAFVETNEVFAEYGIHTIDDLKLYAAEVYDAVYPADAGITDPTDPRNSLNRFVGYHIADKRIDYTKFIFNYNYVAGYDIYEYITTLSNVLLEVCEGEGTNGGLMINKYDTGSDIEGVTILPPEVGGTDQSALNGVFHYIDKILVYDETVKNVVLNKRIRMDVTSLLGELSSNDLRWNENQRYSLPTNYFKNVTASDESLFRYLGPNKEWVNLQGDEFMIVGPYDFTIKLPPLPSANYEIRIGFNANWIRGIAQIYFGSETVGMQPVGIPLNMMMDQGNPSNNPIGSIPDEYTTDNGYENDKLLKNKGWMKAPDTFFTKETGAIARNWQLAVRRIILATDIDENETYYLRFKSVTDDTNRQFHFDYLEFVPKTVYADPNGEDRH